MSKSAAHAPLTPTQTPHPSSGFREAIDRALGWLHLRSSLHPFDRRFGVDTSGLMYAPSLQSGHEHDAHSSGYYATAPSLFHAALSLWNDTLTGTPFTLRDYAFLDLGCGKGRVLMMASEYPLREIVGVELNPALAAIANRNLGKWTRFPRGFNPSKAICDDFLRIPFPAGPVLVYLFNSFEAEMVEALLDRLVQISATRSDPIDLLYIHPDYGQLVRQTPRMTLVADAEIPFTAEDARADVFGVDHDRCTIFRLPGALPRDTNQAE